MFSELLAWSGARKIIIYVTLLSGMYQFQTKKNTNAKNKRHETKIEPFKSSSNFECNKEQKYFWESRQSRKIRTKIHL